MIITTKGEAVALAIAQMSSEDMIRTNHGFVAVTQRVIMDRELYPKKWGYGPVASTKRAALEKGQLDVSNLLHLHISLVRRHFILTCLFLVLRLALDPFATYEC